MTMQDDGSIDEEVMTKKQSNIDMDNTEMMKN